MQDNPQLEPLRESFACVAAAVILVDGKVSRGEMSRFHDFFAREFGVDAAQADALLETGKREIDRLDHHLDVLSEVLPHNLKERGRFLRYFNECIIKDGIDDREYPLFDKIKAKIFP